MSLIGAAAQQGNRVVGYKKIDCYYATSESEWTKRITTATSVYALTILTTIAGVYSANIIIYGDLLGTTVAASGYYGDTAGGDGSTASVWDDGTSTWLSQTTYGYTLTVYYAIDGDAYCIEGATPVNIHTIDFNNTLEDVFNGNKPIYANIGCTTLATNGNYGDTAGGGIPGMNYRWEGTAWGPPTNCPE